MHPQNYTMDLSVQQRIRKKRRPAAPLKRETGPSYAAQEILIDQGRCFCITSVSFIVSCIDTGNGGNRCDDPYKNCNQCHDTECCKTNDCSKFHNCPPCLCKLLKRSASYFRASPVSHKQFSHTISQKATLIFDGSYPSVSRIVTVHAFIASRFLSSCMCSIASSSSIDTAQAPGTKYWRYQTRKV